MATDPSIALNANRPQAQDPLSQISEYANAARALTGQSMGALIPNDPTTAPLLRTAQTATAMRTLQNGIRVPDSYVSPFSGTGAPGPASPWASPANAAQGT